MDTLASNELFRWLTFAITMVGVSLNIKKNKWCFVLWFLANLAWCLIYLMAGIEQGAVTYVVFCATCVWGWIEWSKGGQKDADGH